MIRIINKVGFDINVLGNHEFDYGIQQLMKLEKNLTTKYIVLISVLGQIKLPFLILIKF